MKNSLLLFALALIPVVASAQNDSTIALRRTPRAILKLAPLSIMDQDATIQAGLEYRTGIRTSVQGEIGYGRKGLSPFGSDLTEFVDAEVWRGRAEVRFYSGRYRTNNRRGLAVRSNFPLGNYWAIDGLFKQINVTDRADEYPPVIDGSVSRNVWSMRTCRYVLGSHLKLGRQFAFHDPQKRLFSRTLLDIYLGAGVRWNTNAVRETGQNPSEQCGCGIGRSFTNRGGQWLPSVTAGLKIGFAL